MRRRVLAVTMALTAWVAGTLTGSLGTAPATGMPMLQVGRAHAEFQPTLTGSDPIFVLVLGSDAREGTPLDGGLADSIHLLGINPDAGRATLFGIPRDAWVPLASGGTNKINAAMPAGGVEAQIATVEQLTGIAFDYYAPTRSRAMPRPSPRASKSFGGPRPSTSPAPARACLAATSTAPCTKDS
jgi:anionic cell wall polymer biosynthesis LytR-Cps2A-Psr (LCP) family protein